MSKTYSRGSFVFRGGYTPNSLFLGGTKLLLLGSNSVIFMGGQSFLFIFRRGHEEVAKKCGENGVK